MKILISGSSGLVGSALKQHLAAAGHKISCLVRRPARNQSEISWQPDTQTIETDKLEGLDGVIHLAGESIAAGRWNRDLQARILQSRVLGTRLLATSLGQLSRPPKVMLSASAVGFYGDRAALELDETAAAGQGFLAEVCQAWEAEARAVEACGIRLVIPRISMVLSKRGGALPPMLIPFKLGLGGPLGPGTQFMSWITLTDLVRALEHCLHDQNLNGPVNCCAPQPVSNQTFTDTLGRVLHRPAILPVPAFALKLALGPEMAQELLLASTRAIPRRLKESGFDFQHPLLEAGLKAAIAGE